MPSPVSPRQVKQIVATDDLTLRNVRVTQGYAALSAALGRRTPGVNWCTLGAWASTTAGRFIRGDALATPLRDVLHDTPFTGRIVDHLLNDVRAWISAGNTLVFAELGGVVARYLDQLGDDTRFDAARLRAFRDSLTDGLPEPDEAAWDLRRQAILTRQRGGQAHLRAMVEAWYRSMFEPDARRAAQLVLMGNAHGGVHEQTRLQTCIAGSLNAPVADAVDVLTRLIPFDRIDGLVRDRATPIQTHWRHLATRELMTLTLPEGALHLAAPVPRLRGGPLFPPELDPVELPELEALLARYRCLVVPEDGHRDDDVGATDWADLDQRLHYILVLFRSRADDRQLWADPITGAPPKVARHPAARVATR